MNRAKRPWSVNVQGCARLCITDRAKPCSMLGPMLGPIDWRAHNALFLFGNMLDLMYLAASVALAFMLLTFIVVALLYVASLAVFVAVFVGVAFGGILVTSSFVSPLPLWMLLPIAAADDMRSLLQERAEELAGCIEGSLEEAALARLADVLATYNKARGETQ